MMYDVIVCNFPYTNTSFKKSMHEVRQKKEVTLFLYVNNQQKKEKDKIMWGTLITSNGACLINRWLSFAADEGITKTRISLQSVIVDQSEKHLFISLEQSLFDNEMSTHEKLLIIEGLLKTIREVMPDVQDVYICVQYQPLNDYHLNFSVPWPLGGFLEEKK